MCLLQLQLSVCHCVVSSVLARVPAVLWDGILVFCAVFSAVDMCSSETPAELWAMLPRRCRAEYGCAGGLVPSLSVLAFLVDSADDMGSLVAQYAPGDAHLGHVARSLWTAAQFETTAACKRRSLVDPAWQRVLLACRLPQSETTTPGLCDTLSWLRSQSGACRRSGKLLFGVPSNFLTLKMDSLVKLLTSRGFCVGGVSWRSWFLKQAYLSLRRRSSLLPPTKS